MKKWLGPMFVAVVLAGAGIALTNQDAFCAVCAAWGPDSPLYQFFQCAASCGA